MLDTSVLTLHSLSHLSPVPDDLTPEEQQELENIRRRKQELLEDIQVILERGYADCCNFHMYSIQKQTRTMCDCRKCPALAFTILLTSFGQSKSSASHFWVL